MKSVMPETKDLTVNQITTLLQVPVDMQVKYLSTICEQMPKDSNAHDILKRITAHQQVVHKLIADNERRKRDTCPSIKDANTSKTTERNPELNLDPPAAL